MKTYGLILADNGTDMYITGTHDTRWNNDVLNPAFASLRASDFEVVQRGWQPAPSGGSCTPGNTRLYSDADVERLRTIQQLTELGLNLAGVERVIALEDQLRRMQAQLERMERRMREEVERVHKHYRRDLVPYSQSTTALAHTRERGRGWTSTS